MASVLNVSLTTVGLLTGDPLAYVGAIYQAFNWLSSQFQDQLRRQKENTWSQDVSKDNYIGRVKSGGVWYPCIVKRRHQGEGLIDSSGQITLESTIFKV